MASRDALGAPSEYEREPGEISSRFMSLYCRLEEDVGQGLTDNELARPKTL